MVFELSNIEGIHGSLWGLTFSFLLFACVACKILSESYLTNYRPNVWVFEVADFHGSDDGNF